MIESFSLQNCIKQGISTKEVVAPEVIKIFSRSLNFGRMYSRTFHIVNYPTWIKGDFMTSFLDVPCNMLVSAYYDRMDQVEAARMIKNKGVDISSEVIRRQQNASKSGYDVNLISPDLQDANREKNQLLQNLTKDDERIFKTSFYVTIFAHSKEMLDQYEKQVVSNANKHMASLRCLTSQQERSFNTSLPLAYHESYLQDRIMTTNTVSVIIPFDTKDLQQRNGIYYGQNAVSKRMILADRTLSMNPNACILGMPGAGKSFLAKREIIYVLLNIIFAYFYTSITFNPLEVANNIKRQNGCIPGIRSGKPTSDYLTKILNYIVFVGACGLILVQIIPFICNGVFGASVSFGGTSLIIIASVILETMKQIESQMRVRYYKGFLSD